MPYEATGIASAEAFGTPTLSSISSATGILSSEGFGSAGSLSIHEATAIDSGEAIGSQKLTGIRSATAIDSGEAFGSPGSTGLYSATGIASGEAFGTHKSTRISKAIGIEPEENFGLPLGFTSYLSRPVYEFAKNWRSTPKKRFQYDLNETLLGFASPQFDPIQSHTIQGIDFEVMLVGDGEIYHHDRFVEYLRGRLNGFWIESPFDVFQIEAGFSATQFDIKDQGMRDWFSDHPSTYIALKKGETTLLRKITNVENRNNGKERVTIDVGTSPAIDQTWDAAKLLYVRLAGDEEVSEIIVDGKEIRNVRVVELPTEYAGVETGQMPVYLYEFWLEATGGNVYSRFTGLNQHIRSSGIMFDSFPIEHKELRKTIRRDAGHLVIDSRYDPKNPISKFVPFTIPLPLWVKIYETTFADPDTRSVIFTGQVDEVEIQGRNLTAKCSTLIEILGRRWPGLLFQPICNAILFSDACGIDKTLYDVSCTIKEINGRYVTIESNAPGDPDVFTSAVANFFALGWIETGTGATFEIRTIDQSSSYQAGDMTLLLSHKLAYAKVGQSVTMYPGCDGLWNTCRTKYNNGRRWKGHVIAPSNPTIRAMQAEQSTGNKK